VYAPSRAEVLDPQLYANNVQRVMAAALGVQTTQHGFEDIQLAAVAAKADYPVSLAVVEFSALRAALSIDARTATTYLRRFIAADAAKTGRLSFEQFRGLLQRPLPLAAAGGPTLGPAPAVVLDDALLRRLFDLLDRNDDGSLDFRELLIGLAVLNERVRGVCCVCLCGGLMGSFSRVPANTTRPRGICPRAACGCVRRAWRARRTRFGWRSRRWMRTAPAR